MNLHERARAGLRLLPPAVQLAHGLALESAGMKHSDLAMVRAGRQHQAEAKARHAAEREPKG